MNRFLVLLACALFTAGAHADPLRVFIRGGKKTHGPNAHEHERFLNDWKALLAERGLQTDGAMDWPTAEQLRNTDVLVMYAQDGGNATDEQKANLAEFTRRGGGIVVIHTAAVSNDPPWWKSVIGGAWIPGKTKWKEGPMDLYYVENERIGDGHPITRGASNFHLDDEIYYDMDIAPEVRVLATAYTPKVREGQKPTEGGKANIYDIQPQMWAYEKTAEGGSKPYRAFVSIPGHLYSTFEKPNFRAILLRGISWVAQRQNLDEFVKQEELDSLTYPAGGPSRPADELAQLEVHPEFKMSLVASEPLITKPISFDWDPAGRLWVAESPEYPNGRRGLRPDYRGKEWKDHGGLDPTPGKQSRPALDKISILSSSKGDGVMDAKQVWYEGLDLVTGFVFYQDGVIVTQAPDILWIRDTKGTGRADKVDVLYHGLGTFDTHAVINNPRWGWDGWIYATHGYSSSQNVTNGDGTKNFGTIGSGVVRFKPDGSAIEQYSSKGGNTWGLEITGDNRVMWTQPTSGQLLMQTLLPESVLARGKIGDTASYNVIIPSDKVFPAMAWEQLAYVQIDWVGSFTAAAGCVVYDGGSWPAVYNGSYFCTEPTVNIVHQRFLDPAGSSYGWHKQAGREETEFVRSRDMWFRPIEVRVGPDGAIYVADFYNQAVIHNDTRGPDHNNVNAAVRPDRDHYFGRIWRIDHKDAAKLAALDLSRATMGELIKGLEHPNREVRMTASRLIVERRNEFSGDADAYGSLRALLKDGNPDIRIAALFTLDQTRSDGGNSLKLSEVDFLTALSDESAEVRRGAANVAETPSNYVRSWETPQGQGTGPAVCLSDRTAEAFRKLVADPEAPVRIAALRALTRFELPDETAKAIVAAWPKFDDDFQRSAAVAAASRNPVATIAAALESADALTVAPLVRALVQNIDADSAGKLVVVLANAPASADALRRSILEGAARAVKGIPALTPELVAALGRLLDGSLSGAILPLAVKWDTTGALKPQVAKLTGELLSTLGNSEASDDARLAAARSLVGIRSADSEILSMVVAQLDRPGSVGFQRALVAALGETDDARVGAALSAAYAKLPAGVQPAAFDAVLKRADWSNAFLDAVKAKQVDPATLGPASAFRLRAHPDKSVAKRATSLLDALNPSVKAKKDVIAKLLPVVEQRGDPEHGKQLFATTCAVCHSFHGVGADIGPGLTGMGAHGAGELLTAIVDPNAEVDPSFTQWNVETNDGQTYAGAIAAENPASLTLKSLAGVQQVRTADVKSRVNTNRSLMPEGFDGLGGEALRDIITYLQSADASPFRPLDLHDAFTVSTMGGIYRSQAEKGDMLEFAKSGPIWVEGVPFNVVSPEKALGAPNVVVLKGGPEGTFSKSLPQKAEVKVGGFRANRLHFLGGVTGWGYQNNGETGDVLRITVHTTEGQRETLLCRNGIEFADFVNRLDVPGSRYAEGLVKRHQMRWFTKQLSGPMDIDRITLESLDTGAAPTIVAITAELTGSKAPESAPPH